MAQNKARDENDETSFLYVDENKRTQTTSSGVRQHGAFFSCLTVGYDNTSNAPWAALDHHTDLMPIFRM